LPVLLVPFLKNDIFKKLHLRVIETACSI